MLYVNSEWHDEVKRTADNLVIAKMMYDIGKPLPAETSLGSVYFMKDPRFFLVAIERLFERKPQIVGPVNAINSDDVMQELSESETIQISCKFELLIHWKQLRERCNAFDPRLGKQMDIEFDRITEPLSKSKYCEYEELQLTSKFAEDSNLIIQIDGLFGMFSSFLKVYVDFVMSMTRALKKWQHIYKFIHEHMEVYHDDRNHAGNVQQEAGSHDTRRWISSDYKSVG